MAVAHDLEDAAAEDVALAPGVRLEEAHGEVLSGQVGDVRHFHLFGQCH